MSIISAWIIFAVTTLFFLAALIMLLPSKYSKSREVAFAERKKIEYVVECESSSFFLCVARYLTIWCMGFSLFWYSDTIWPNEEPDIRILSIFIVGFIMHYFVFVQLDRKFYVTQSGLWINEIVGEPIQFNEIEIYKAWFTTAPFSGLAGNLLINFSCKGKFYTAYFERFDEEDELYEQYKEELALLGEWLHLEIGLDKKRQPIFRKMGIGMISVGAILTLAIIPAIGLADDNEYENLTQGEVVYHEMWNHAESVEVCTSRKYIYSLPYNKPVINVYDALDEKYLFSYVVPPGEHGQILYAVVDDSVYVKNKEDVVYLFKDEKYIDEMSYDSLSRKVKRHLINSETEHEVIEQDTIFVADYFFIIGVIGIIICIIGGFIFNKGRFSLKKEEQ